MEMPRRSLRNALNSSLFRFFMRATCFPFSRPGYIRLNVSKHLLVQIVKILNSYTPIDDFEKRVSSSFVRKVQVSSAVFCSTGNIRQAPV